MIVTIGAMAVAGSEQNMLVAAVGGYLSYACFVLMHKLTSLAVTSPII